jgi:hypothetical protein
MHPETKPDEYSVAVELYTFDIQRADKAKALNELHAEIVTDERLDSHERNQLCEEIRAKFCRLNREALGTPKTRW